MSFLYCFYSTQLQEVLVASFDVVLLVSSGGTNPKCPGSFNASVLFVTVLVCSIILINYFIVNFRVIFGQATYGFLVLFIKLEEEL